MIGEADDLPFYVAKHNYLGKKLRVRVLLSSSTLEVLLVICLGHCFFLGMNCGAGDYNKLAT